jgi:hypothetical protein
MTRPPTRLRRAPALLLALGSGAGLVHASACEDGDTPPPFEGGAGAGGAGAPGGASGTSGTSGTSGASGGAAAGGADAAPAEAACRAAERRDERCALGPGAPSGACRATNACRLTYTRPEYFEALARCYDGLGCDAAPGACVTGAAAPLAGQEYQPFFGTCLGKAATCGDEGGGGAGGAPGGDGGPEARCRYLATAFRPSALDGAVRPCLASVCTREGLDDCLRDATEPFGCPGD